MNIEGVGELLARVGPLGAACVLSLMAAVGLLFYAAHRVNEARPVRWPTWALLLTSIVIASATGWWLAARSPGAATSPPPQAVATFPARTAIPQQLKRRDLAERPLPARRTGAPEIAAPTQEDPRPDYTCGPPYYLAWFRTTEDDYDSTVPEAQTPKECSALMSENGYNKGFPTKVAALAAAAAANRCAAPHHTIWEADLDKC